MATTFMDVSLFGHFSVIFVFLLVFVITYGFLSATKIFKAQTGEKGLYAIIALAISFLISMSSDALSVVINMTPWFTVLIIFMFLVFFVVRMWAGDDDDMFKNLIKMSTVYWILIIVFILIFISALSSTYGQRMLDNNPQVQALPGGEDVQMEDGTIMTVEEAQDAGYEIVAQTTTTTVSTPAGSTATTDFSGNVMATIIHPKVLGMLLFMVISFFMIIFIARSGNPDNN